MRGTRAWRRASSTRAHHAQRDLARVPPAAQLRSRSFARSGRRGRCRGNWFGGGSTSPRATSSRNSRSRRGVPRHVPSSGSPAEERKAFLLDRQGAIAGRKTRAVRLEDRRPDSAARHDLPGTWTFNLRAIYDGADAKVDETRFLFHWAYLNETIVRRAIPARRPGGLVHGPRDPRSRTQAAEISGASTRRSELPRRDPHRDREAFQLGFVSMTEAILRRSRRCRT